MWAFWLFVSDHILKYRWIWLSLLALSTTYMILVQGNEVAQHFALAIPDDSEEMKTFLRFKETYGDDGLLILVSIEQKSHEKHDQNLLKPLFQFGEKCRQIDGVNAIISPSHFQELKYDPQGGRFFLTDFLEKMPEDSLIRQRWNQFVSNPFYSPILLNADTSHALMIIVLDAQKLDTEAKFGIIEKIYAAGDSFASAGEYRLAYAGMPVFREYMLRIIPQELSLFMGCTLLVAALVLFFFFRSLPLVLIPLVNMGVAILWALGILGLLGYQMNLLTGTIPALIGIISLPNFLYLVSHYQIEYERLQDKKASFRKVFGEIGFVMLLSNLTTAIGFAMIAFSDIQVLREFGIACSLSILAAFVISIIGLPIGLSQINPSPRYKSNKKAKVLMTAALQRMGDWVIYQRKWIYVASFLLVGISVFYMLQIRVEAFMLDDIPDRNTLQKDLKEIESHFGGVMPYEVLVDAGKRRAFSSWSNLNRLHQFEQSLDSLDKVSGFRSLADLLSYGRQAFWGGAPDQYGFPDRNELAFILDALRKTDMDFRQLGFQLADSSLSQARISGRIYDLGTMEMEKINQQVYRLGEAVFDSSKYGLTITGTTQVFLKGNDYLVNNLFFTIFIGLMIVSLIVGISFRSYKLWIASISTNLLPLLIVAGIMGLMGIPLKPSTCIVFCISFGIAIDDSLHFIIRYQHRRLQKGLQPVETVRLTLRETGIGMVLTSLVLFLGFSIFLGSAFGGINLLGLLTAMTLFFALFCNLLLLPAILLSLDA